jgi:hypothetical protein
MTSHTAILLLAIALHRPLPLVKAVYDCGGLDAVALVECESCFHPQAIRHEPRGHTSWGLFQLDDEWHPQHREDLTAHIYAGVLFLTECKMASKDEMVGAVERYNGSREWGRIVTAKRDSLALFLWRHAR